MAFSLRFTALAATTTTLFASGTLAAPQAPSYGRGDLPVVDLGYERHQAAFFNETGQFYNFSNIRYAAPPIGENRFRVPQPPAQNRDEIQTGSQGRICPQASPAWGAISAQFIPAYLAGQTVFNESSFNLTSDGEAPAVDPRTTEDCLFADVVVPKDIYDNAGNGKGAAVLVWIYGGGYTAGSKAGSGNPAGLLRRSQSDNSKGVIYVSFNYRLGALGWLSGPTFQENGTANAGLHDQRFALEWIQKNIHLFGGDKDRVTVFGESAGGGSVMHQITAYGGNKGPVPFAQALPQSPGWIPIVSNQQQEQTFNDFLSFANVTSLAEARELSTEQVILANAQQIGGAPFGQFVYGPTVDGDFVPTLPGVALLHGQYPKDLKVMVGHNAQEGLLFTSPFIQNNSAFNQYLTTSLPTLRSWPAVEEYISDELYPPVFDGSQAQNYTDQIARAAAVSSELVFTCNTYYMNKAYGNNTFAYYFTIPPALHGQDIAYTYYNGPSEDVVSDAIAIALQEYITQWAQTGNPNEPGVPYFPIYGDNATVQDLGIDGIEQVMDPTANARCEWWQKALYL